MHHKEYEFPIDPSKFDEYLSKEQLDTISFTCDDLEFFAVFGEGPDMSEFENQIDLHMSDA